MNSETEASEPEVATPEEKFEAAEEVAPATEELPAETFEKKEEEEEKEEQQEEGSEEEEEEDEKKKYSLLEQQYNELSTQFEQLKADYQLLVDYKNEVENNQKDALSQEFYMLSEQDKKDVIENKANYSLDEIKAILYVICYEKKVNFNSDNYDNFNTNEEKEIIT